MTVRRQGICRVCGRLVHLVGDGLIGRHGAKDPTAWPPKMCEGWRQPQKEQS